MRQKTIYSILFILVTITLAIICLLTVLFLVVLVTDLYDVLSHNTDEFICGCEETEAILLENIFLYTVILCVDILLFFILFFVFKKTRAKMKKPQKNRSLIN